MSNTSTSDAPRKDRTIREIDLFERAGGRHTGSTLFGKSLASLLKDQGIDVIQHMTYGYFIAEVNIDGERKWLRIDINAFQEQFAALDEFEPEVRPTRFQWLKGHFHDWIKRSTFDGIGSVAARLSGTSFDGIAHNALLWMREAETRDVEVTGKMLQRDRIGGGFIVNIPGPGLADFTWNRVEFVDPNRPFPEVGEEFHFMVSPQVYRRGVRNKAYKVMLQVKDAIDNLAATARAVYSKATGEDDADDQG